MRKRNRHSHGFTIIELLIVIVIIAILAGIVITIFVGVQQKARLQLARVEMLGFGKAASSFVHTEERYPTTDAEFAIILKDAQIYNSTRTPDKSYAICASPTGYAIVAWQPVITAYKNGAVLYLYGEAGGLAEYELRNSSLSAADQLNKICTAIYNGPFTYQSWSYDIP